MVEVLNPHQRDSVLCCNVGRLQWDLGLIHKGVVSAGISGGLNHTNNGKRGRKRGLLSVILRIRDRIFGVPQEIRTTVADKTHTSTETHWHTRRVQTWTLKCATEFYFPLSFPDSSETCKGYTTRQILNTQLQHSAVHTESKKKSPNMNKTGRKRLTGNTMRIYYD